jgi:hypothetical protein
MCSATRPREVKVSIATQLGSVPGLKRRICIGRWPPGGQLALETDVGRRKKLHSAASIWRRHVLAAPSKGIISGRTPATLRQARQANSTRTGIGHEPKGKAQCEGRRISQQTFTRVSARITRLGTDGGQTFVGIGVSERVGEVESKVRRPALSRAKTRLHD